MRRLTHRPKGIVAVCLTICGMFFAISTITSGAPREPKQKPKLEKRSETANADQQLQQKVGHQLRMLAYYSVFDNIEYRLSGGKVELLGQVVQPRLKSDAEAAVKRIEGVEGVENNIEVLPPSPDDDRIRVSCYRAIYMNGALQRYAMQPVPSIHIIVKNGHVTLAGVVDNETDKNIAFLQANGVDGAFSVTNNLRVEKTSAASAMSNSEILNP
jgi:osmotically-inducible protein OsmY